MSLRLGLFFLKVRSSLCHHHRSPSCWTCSWHAFTGVRRFGLILEWQQARGRVFRMRSERRKCEESDPLWGRGLCVQFALT